MMDWISAHWIAIVVVVVGTYLGRGLFRGLLHRQRMSSGRSHGVAFCNHCGWKGSVRRSKQVCGKCGSVKLTLQTN